ncbi:MAG TPA: TonB family protein [Gammaproteobacteria bacterium]|nr:TonB family protein [Gammaproteobacteria bacterium]
MSTAPTQASARPADRLTVTLFLAAALHALLILGVSFSPHLPDTSRSQLPVLDVTVVTHPRSKAPKDADYLANADQDGTGNVHHKVRPQPRQTAHTPPPAKARTRPDRQPQVVTTQHSQRQAPAKPRTKPAPPAAKPSAGQLISKSMALVQMDQQANQPLKAYSKQERQTYISARTRQYKYAAYMSAWVHKVERVGNLNYPEAARRKGLSGRLLLDVALNSDGSIRNITIRRSSGHKLLDDAAKRIVRLAGPFAPFPASIRKDTDVLHITRTWEFLNSNQLSSE